MITLPEPSQRGTVTVEEALSRRRSTRTFSPETIGLERVGQLLWSAYGVTGPNGWRTTPSAMECYPLEISLVAANVSGLEAGLYSYDGSNHSLTPGVRGELLKPLFDTTFNQTSILESAAVLVISACYARSEPKFGDAARDYVHMEVGHAGQNVHLQAEALGLGTVVIAAFRPGDAAGVLRLPEGQTPVYLMPFGRQ